MLKRITPILLSAFAALLFTACPRVEPCLLDECEPPMDKAPAITLISPSNNNVLKMRNDIAVFDFRLDDNEALRLFRVTGQILDPKDSLIGTESILIDKVIQGKTSVETFAYWVPNTLSNAYKVRLTAYAIDTKGAYSKAIAWVNVVDTVAPSPGIVDPERKDGIIYSKLSATHPGEFRFDFGGTNPPSALNADVEETSGNAGTFDRVWKPGQINGFSGVFVMTNAASFNYDQLSFNTTYQAFFSSPNVLSQSAAINAGDIIIVRLPVFGTTSYAFSVVRVKEVNDDPNGDNEDYIKFDYKITYK